jgi:hypothetical protein
MNQSKYKKKLNNTIKSTLKRLMVPEITPPHAHLISDESSNIKPVLTDKITKGQDMSAIASNPSSSNSKFIQQDSQATQTKPSIATDPETTQSYTMPNQSSSLTELESALHPPKNTSIWVMLGLALLMLVVAAAVLFLIILS